MPRRGTPGGGGGLDTDLPIGEGSTTADFGTVQDGYLENPLVTGWTDDTGNLGDATDKICWYGLVFDVSSLYSTESERGLALDPPVINYMELTLTRGPSSQIANDRAEAFVFFVPQMTQFTYGDVDDRPSLQEEWLIGYTSAADAPEIFNNTTSITLPIGNDDRVVDGSAIRLIYNANTLVNEDDTLNLLQNFGRFQSFVQNSQWDGTFALSVFLDLKGTGTGNVQMYSSRGAGTAPSLSVTTHSFHSGQFGMSYGRRSRIRHDPKSGFPGHSDEFIDDGYFEGMKVLPDSYDPPDRTNMDFFPPSTEGVVDDEVP
jgi:hypothetical protein